MNTETKKKILIVGGGFAGVRCALDLAHHASDQLEITLLSSRDYFEYYPAMYRVVTNSSPARVKIPLEEIFASHSIVERVIDRAVDVDVKNKKVTGKSGTIYEADVLMLCVGSQANYFNIEGIEELSFNFRTVDRALELRDRIHTLFEEHAHGDKEDTLRALHFVVVGGGPSGVELAGELSLYTRNLAQQCNVPDSFVTVDLVEASSRILQRLPEKVSRRATARLNALGVNVFANRTLVKSDTLTVFLNDMEIGARTVIWTAGVKNSELFLTMKDDLEFDGKGRVIVNEHLQANGYDHVFVAGDNAATPFAGLAQTAIYDGAYLAKNIIRELRDKKPLPYTPKPNDYDIPIGPGWAILSIKGLVFFGWLPWVMRHLIDLRFYLSILPLRKALQTFFARPHPDDALDVYQCRTYEYDTKSKTKK